MNENETRVADDPVLSENLKMVFDLDGSKTHTISLPDPKLTLTKSEAIAVADYIIAQEAITSAGLPVTALKDVYIAISGRKELAV